MKYIFVIALLAFALNAFAFDRENQSTLTPTQQTQETNKNVCDSKDGYACSSN
jgi:hypothetical protein